MSFNFGGAPTTAASSGFSFGSAPATQSSFGSAPATQSSGGFSLTPKSTAGTTGFGFGGAPAASTTAATSSVGGLGAGFGFGGAPAASTPAATSSVGALGGFGAQTQASTQQPNFSFATKTPATNAGVLGSTAAPTNPLTQAPPSLGAASSTGGFGGFSLGGGTTQVASTSNTLGTPSNAPPAFGLTGGSQTAPLPFNFSGTSTATTAPPTIASALTASTAASSTPILGAFLSSSASTASAAVTTSSTTFSLPAVSAVTALSTATTTSSQIGVTPVGEMINVRQLEERLNKWHLEAKEMEDRFRRQAHHVNAWDAVLQKGHTQVHDLRGTIDTVERDQDRLEAELDFIKGQQSELELLLGPLESSVNDLGNNSALTGISQQGDKQRDNMYHLAQNLDGQLRQMSDDLATVIDHVNTLNGSEKSSDSVVMVAKILSAHMDTLKWIDENSSSLNNKIDEIARTAQ